MSTSGELKQKGNAEFNAGRYREALAFYEEALEIDPRNIDLLNNAAAANYSLGRHDDAISYARRSISICDNHKAHMRLGESLWSLNRLADALAEYERAATLSPNNAGIEQNINLLRVALLQQSHPTNFVYPCVSSGKVGVLFDVAVFVFALLTLICQFFAPIFAQAFWTLLLLFAVGQKSLVAHREGLLRPTRAVLMKWANCRCTLEVLLCLVAFFTRVRPQILLVFVLGIYSVVSIATNQRELEGIAPAIYRIFAPYIQKAVANRVVLVSYAATMEALMLFTVIFMGSFFFMFAYIKFIKNIYRVDGNTRIVFSGIRVNIARITRSQYVPFFVDRYVERACDLLYKFAMDRA